ncbi:MAG TPA: aminopeptidase [Burkholderiales bacterium]|nr:aminopeptidase [Burkholderiales bacterium]
MTRVFLALACTALLGGCDTIGYYRQAIGGHLGVMAAARPIDALLADPATPPDLRQRLEVAQRIRAFASHSLGLPDNGSYLSYADIGRSYVVYNVFAAAEFSVEPHRECFPVTGCVAYRGFFSEADARRHAEKLKAQGLDVYVGGVPAYSTLGWFDDPLLSTFIRYSDGQLARLIFHELAHQVVYAKGNTTFNESFAVVVEEEGVKRWLVAEGRPQELEAFRTAQARRKALAASVKAARARLAAVYASGASPEALRAAKEAEFARLRAEHPQRVPAQASNGFLVAIALYNELVPQLEQVLRESGSLEAFYARARDFARSDALRVKPPGPAASR